MRTTMRKAGWWRILAVALAAASVMGSPASADEGGAPERAVCRACELRGAGHGVEKVVASREHDGVQYHFCSKQCAEAFDAFPEGYVDHPVPRPAPDVTITTTEGAKVSAAAPGGPVLVDFWATWCKPCIEAMPSLADLQNDYADAGLRVVGVSIDEDEGAFRKFVKKKSVGYAVALDSAEQPAWHSFHVVAIPAMFLIDGEGQVVAEWRGAPEPKAVRAAVEELLGDG